jgi:hypothetical protein
MTWREAVYEVMRKARRPMHYTDVWDEIRRRKLYRTSGDSPERTVGGILYKETETYEQVDTSTFRLRKGARRAGPHQAECRRLGCTAGGRRAASRVSVAGRPVTAAKTVVELLWLGMPYEQIRNYPDALLYAVSRGKRLLYMGLSFHTDVAVEIYQNMKDFGESLRGLTIWLAYPSGGSVKRVTRPLVADCERLLVYTHQPGYNSHLKDAYKGRSGLVIHNQGSRFLRKTCVAP